MVGDIFSLFDYVFRRSVFGGFIRFLGVEFGASFFFNMVFENSIFRVYMWDRSVFSVSIGLGSAFLFGVFLF